MKQPIVLIAALDGSDTEVMALRSALEYFGAFVAVKWVGRPRDFMDVLNGNLPLVPDYVVISGHGDENSFIMGKLGEDVYEPDEPRGNFTPKEVEKYLKIKSIVISTCCTTGGGAMSDIFSKGGCTYIAPADYVEGNSALMFVIRFFYEILQNKASVNSAFGTARETDDETKLFVKV